MTPTGLDLGDSYDLGLNVDGATNNPFILASVTLK